MRFYVTINIGEKNPKGSDAFLKKFLLFLIIAVTFCSCSKTENPQQEFPAESSSESSSEETKVFPEPDFKDIEVYIESVLQNDIKSTLKNPEVLESNGINFSAENISVAENRRFSCNLVLEKDGKEKVFPAKGVWFFAKDNFKKQNYSGFESFIKVSFGGASFAGKNRTAICLFEKAVVFDSENFSDFMELEFAENFWPVGAFCDESGVYVPAYNLSGYSKMFLFDKNAKLWQEQNLAKVDMNAWLGFPLPDFHIRHGIIGDGEWKYFVSKNVAYNVFGGTFYRANPGKILSYGDYDIIFYEYYSTDNSEKDEVYFGKCAALFHKEKGFVTSLQLSDKDFDINSKKISLFYDGKLFFRSNDGYSNKINLNFGEIVYNDRELYSKFVLEEQIAAFGDKAYSLWKAENYSAGDGESYMVVLKNEQDGKTFELSENGGSVSGNHSEGFLKNGDAYIMNSQSLKIYSAGTNEISFYSDNAFGKISDKIRRSLLAFRRDPDDFSFIVLYYERTDANGEDPVYMLAFLNPEGEFEEIYKSDIKVPLYYGAQNVLIHYSEDKLVFTALEGKGSDEFSFAFDMETKTFLRSE